MIKAIAPIVLMLVVLAGGCGDVESHPRAMVSGDITSSQGGKHAKKGVSKETANSYTNRYGHIISNTINSSLVSRIAPVASDIAQAYTNRDYRTFRELWVSVADRLREMSPCYYEEAMGPVFSVVSRGFLQYGDLETFEAAEELERYLRFNVNVMHLLGDLEKARGSYSVTLRSIDYGVLDRLNRYKKMYEESGAVLHLKVVERVISDWHKHIESGEGYTYNYMKLRLRLEMEGVKFGVITPESVLRGVRMEANGLIKCGCVPKWLDEFK